ncbi:MAG: response regulator transcription factor [Elusimicrobiota bacterium]|jgi:DNA-binding response OmpR family regulator
MKNRIVLIEDDPALRKMLKEALPESIFTTEIAETGHQGLELVVKRKPDLVLLDWSLPDLNGLEVCRLIKQNKDCAHIPIIMVTAYAELNRKVSALEGGADDYVTKPFEIEELIARIKAVLRRRVSGGTPEEIIQKEGITINLTTYSVDVEKRPLTLTAKEFDLLYVLMKNAGRILNREFLLERIWGYAVDVSTRTVDVHIRRLRKKLGNKCAQLIQTFRGVGYKFKEDNRR